MFGRQPHDQEAHGDAVVEMGLHRLAPGIAEALVATAIGLIVAIPSVIAYNAFQRRVKRLLSEADALTGMALALLAESGAKKKG